MGGVEIKPSDNMTYLGIILDQKLNWSLHIKTKVSKAIKWLAVLKPTIDHIFGLSPSKMLWIYKQILLPRITYGAHVWGHSLTLEQQHLIKSLESLTFRYFAQIWKNTPTASLEVILNKKPAHLEVLSTAIKTFMRIKDQFQTNFWDGFPLGNRGCSHLKKLKQITSQIYLEDQSLDSFISDYRKNPIFNWNPPVRDLLQAACANDIDDQVELDKFQLVESYTQTDQTTTNTDNGHNKYTVDVTVRSPGHPTPVDGNVRVLPVRNLTDANTQTTGFDRARDPDNVESDDSLSVENHSKHDNTNTDNDHDMYTVDVTVRSPGPITPVDGNIRVFSDLTLTDANTQTTGSGHSQNLDTDRGLLPVDGNVQVTGNKGVLLPAHVLKGAAKVNELTLELFDNNFNLYAQKINHHEDGLFIRAILMKNNNIIFNNTYKINGTSNVAIATIASADQVCNQYLVLAGKGDSFICALGDGHHGVQNPIIRNEHLANFINTLNSIKVKIGLYTIVTGLKSDWLQYASHNTIYQELSLAPDKKIIIPTIESFLNDKWFKSWDDLAGHAQTKYWLPRPDSFLASKLLQMSRKHLGYNIQFFSGHGWWRKHLMTAKLSKSDKCRLCLEDQAVKTPIHIFSECPAMAGFRKVLFNDTYPSQHTGQQSLCQVTELALHGSVQELIERTDQFSYVHSTE